MVSSIESISSSIGMTKVYIEWTDAYTRDGWDSSERVVEGCDSLMLCKSIGWLVSKNKKRVIISHTFNTDSLMGCLHIPMACVKKIKVIDK